jgi:hypothetical protein
MLDKFTDLLRGVTWQRWTHLLTCNSKSSYKWLRTCGLVSRCYQSLGEYIILTLDRCQSSEGLVLGDQFP